MEKLCVVKTIDTAARKITAIMLVVLGVIFVIGAILFGKIIFLIPAVALFVVYFVNYYHAPITYDYTYFGNELKIARIKGDNRRKLLYTINLDDTKMITRADDPALYNIENGQGVVKKDLSSYSGTGKLYKVVFAVDGKNIILTIEPSEDFLDALCEKYSRIITR